MPYGPHFLLSANHSFRLTVTEWVRPSICLLQIGFNLALHRHALYEYLQERAHTMF